MFAYATDEAGNSTRADFDRMTFPKPFKKSRIDLDDKFLGRVVPAILDTTTEVNPQGDMLQKFLVVNGELRRKNSEKIAGFAKQSAPEILWGGLVFHPFTNSAVEAAFADQRTYVYQGKEVDRQTHLGFDLARVVNSPVVAANRGKVLYAAPLGIYGNCIILDHGTDGRERTGDGQERHDRSCRRRPPALHDAGERTDGQSRRMVGRALDPGPDPPQAPRSFRFVIFMGGYVL